jgi:hypothetical protein
MLLSNMHALLGCLGIATAYVALLYTMSPAQLPRSHPFSIKQRTKAVILACALSWLPLFFMIGKVRPDPDDCQDLNLLRWHQLLVMLQGWAFVCQHARDRLTDKPAIGFTCRTAASIPFFIIWVCVYTALSTQRCFRCSSHQCCSLARSTTTR